MVTQPLTRLLELAPEKLRWRCDPARIPFETTEQAELVEGPVGQDRGLRALKLGVELAAPGYNLFACGLSGTGRAAMTGTALTLVAPEEARALEALQRSFGPELQG